MKQASVVALMATAVAAANIHNHGLRHAHAKRDMVTKIETKVEPHIALATVYVDQNGKRLDGKPKGEDSYHEAASYGKAAGENGTEKKETVKKETEEKPAPKPVGKKYGQSKQKKPASKPASKKYGQPKQKKPVQAESYESPAKEESPAQGQQQTPQEIQQGYADKQQENIDAQEELIKQQQAKNAQQPGVGGAAPQSKPQDQGKPQEQPKQAPKQYQPAPPPQEEPKKPSYSPSSGGEGGMKEGQVTYYAAGLGSCGQTNGPSDHIVALSSSLMGSKENCGRSLEIKGPGGTFNAKVADTCPGCDATHLDLPENFYMKVTDGDKAAGHVPVSWKWT
ncbi:MAG: hypothetical protein M1831_003362 [Alyxoria varia]|nr:MAG: hypothetical protein M1831_003362 [Alyxoria varia]